MKIKIIMIACILFVTAFIVSCESEKVHRPLYSELSNSENGVDIWTSTNYQIITDEKKIKEVEPSSNESILLNILIKYENKGRKRAELFNTELNESAPFKYVHGSGHDGINHGYLDPDETYELYRYYTFEKIEDAEEFIAKSGVLLEWKEKGENKQILLKLPSKPTR